MPPNARLQQPFAVSKYALAVRMLSSNWVMTARMRVRSEGVRTGQSVVREERRLRVSVRYERAVWVVVRAEVWRVEKCTEMRDSRSDSQLLLLGRGRIGVGHTEFLQVGACAWEDSRCVEVDLC
jgi:hypothetical protein